LAVAASLALVPAARGEASDPGVTPAPATSAPATAAGGSAREEIDSGVVEALELERGSIVIEGYRYVLTPDVSVSINGTTAAAADLAVGMQVQFRFLRADGLIPRLLEVRVVPSEQRIYRR
jgi:hypothetical protein